MQLLGADGNPISSKTPPKSSPVRSEESFRADETQDSSEEEDFNPEFDDVLAVLEAEAARKREESLKPKAETTSSAKGPSLLFADGGGSSPTSSKAATKFDVPLGDEEIPDFDPNFDYLAAKRPKYDLGKASGRPDEVVWGAVAPESAEHIGEWCEHMRNADVDQLVGLFTESEVAARSPDGTVMGYMKALVDAGFDPNFVSLIDPTNPDARNTFLSMCRDAYSGKRTLCLHCADGMKFTGLAMADWLLTDYIQSENYLEACESLRAQKRKSGVERLVSEDDLENWVQNGHA
jgi:hypothetical protein